MSFSIVIVMGNLTRDVELRYLPSGTPVGDFGVAVNRKWKNDQGELKEEVAFLNCTAFGKTAETLSQYTKKGSAVHLTGHIRQDNWDDKETGAKRTALKIIVDRFQFLPDGKARDGGSPRKPAQRSAADQGDSQAEAPQPDRDDDIPF